MKTRVAWGHNKVIQSNNDAKGGFYASVKWVIFIAKYVGLLPLNIKHSGSLQRYVMHVRYVVDGRIRQLF